MRIGIDATLATGHGPGLGRYARELIRALVAEYGAEALALWNVSRMPQVEALGLPDPPPQQFRLALPRRLAAPLAKLGLHPGRRLAPIDGFHRVHPGVPVLRGTPHTVAVTEGPPPSPGVPRPGDWGPQWTEEAHSAHALFFFSSDLQSRFAGAFPGAGDRCHTVPVGADHWLRDLGGARPQARPWFVVLGA
ncbi:MAG: hypothetical protein R3F17_17470, partial [Planctomycetota bacterium]